MKDSKSDEEIREVSYTTFVKSIEEKQFQRVEKEKDIYTDILPQKGEFRLNIAEAKTESTPVIVYKARTIYRDVWGSDSLLLSKMEDAGLDVKAIPPAQTPFILNLLASWLQFCCLSEYGFSCFAA